MRKFIIKVLSFIFGFTAIILVFFIINYVIVYKTEFSKAPDNVKTLVLGDSHTRFSVNDKYVQNSLNLSQSADSYFYSYLKLKFVLDHNPQIKRVMLSFSDHNLLKTSEVRWFANPAHQSDRFRKYCYFLSERDFMKLFSSNASTTLTSIVSIPKYSGYLITKFKKKNISLKNLNIGGFEGKKGSSLKKSIDTLVTDRKINPHINTEYSQLELEYLNKIIKYCADKKVELIFLVPPVHPKYVALSQSQIKVYKKFYKENLSQIPLLDYSQLNLPDSCYSDCTHLNTVGARTFSVALQSKISSTYNN